MRVFGGNVIDEELRDEVRRLKKSNRRLFLVSALSMGISLFLAVWFIRVCFPLYLGRVDEISTAVSDVQDTVGSELSDMSGRLQVTEAKLIDIEDHLSLVDENMGILDENIRILDAGISDLAGSSGSFNINTSGAYVADPGVIPERYAGYWSLSGDVSQSDIDEIIRNYEIVPENVRRMFEEDGWSIVILNGEIEPADDLGVNSKIGAMTVYGDHIIYLTLYDKTSIIHEMGHYLDCRNDFCSLSMPSAIYETEWQNLLLVDPDTHEHNYSTVIEYFAESFNMWCVKRDEFCSACPETARYIESFLW